MSERRVNVRSIIFNDGKLLAVKHKTSTGGEADYWAIPGGGLDPHESLENGTRREVMEELGVTARVGKLLFMQQFASTRKGFSEELELFFHIENPEDFSTIDFTTTSHGADELARCEFIDPKKEQLLPLFLSTIDIASHIERDSPVRIVDNFKEDLE